MLSAETHWENHDASGEVSSGRSLYNFYRTYDPVTGRYLEADPIGQAGGLGIYQYAESNPMNRSDRSGLTAAALVLAHPERSIAAQVGGATWDFGRNYVDMRAANTINSDRYFHCRANCQATRRGDVGRATACVLSDTREWFDQNMKGDPPNESLSDQQANAYGRYKSEVSPSSTCSAVCGDYRPTALGSEY